MNTNRDENTIWFKGVPNKNECELEFIQQFFTFDERITPKKQLKEKDRDIQVLMAILLGESNRYENSNFCANQIGTVLRAIEGDGTLKWNYYSVLRELEQQNRVIRQDSEYIVSPSTWEKIKDKYHT